MKLVGVFNPLGFSPLDEEMSNNCWPIHLRKVYQDNNGKYYGKYLQDSGINGLISILKSINNPAERALELTRFLSGGYSGYDRSCQYRPRNNGFYFEESIIDPKSKVIQTCYTELEDFPNEKLRIEPDYKVSLDNMDNAVLFPNSELYIGSSQFVCMNNIERLSIDNKTVHEIGNIINFLIDLNYLDVAQAMIDKIKASNINLSDFDYNVVFGSGTNNRLVDAEESIKVMKYVKERTAHLGLSFFKK